MPKVQQLHAVAPGAHEVILKVQQLHAVALIRSARARVGVEPRERGVEVFHALGPSPRTCGSIHSSHHATCLCLSDEPTGVQHRADLHVGLSRSRIDEYRVHHACCERALLHRKAISALCPLGSAAESLENRRGMRPIFACLQHCRRPFGAVR